MVAACQTSEELSFVRGGRLNIVIIRDGKDARQVSADPSNLLSSEATVRASTMDAITFQPNVFFKVTLDFKKAQQCIEGSSRELTDWVLLTASGGNAVFNKTEETLQLQMCEVRTLTNVAKMRFPVQLVLAWDEDHWAVEKVFR